MSEFWNKKGIKPQEVAYREAEQAQPMELDEEVLQELQEDRNVDIFEEEEENTAELMADANLRLEQGRLYQMVLQGNIFADTNADARAIKNVQREIHKFVRERMEVMLGIRQEKVQETVVSSPFNDLEVVALKMLADKVTKGATSAPQVQQAPVLPEKPKKDGITSISGNLRPNPSPLVKKELPKKPVVKQKVPAKSALTKEDEFESHLQKPIEEMTPEELAAHDAAALERRSRNYAKMPNNLVPHPDPASLQMLYTMQANQISGPGSAVSNIMALMNKR